MNRQIIITLVVLLVGGLVGVMILKKEDFLSTSPKESPIPVGEEVARYRGVPAYQNGNKVTQSHGKHYAKDGYYYGQKWQCVEYVKRFYHDALDHQMPSVWGHAKDFFNPKVRHGEINTDRGLVQYENGGDVMPKPDDLLVFRGGSLGHVAIVTKVTTSAVEVIQQNVYGHPMASHELTRKEGKWIVGTGNQPAGWLRLPPKN